jgi:rhodanese-related sulfurtransferase
MGLRKKNLSGPAELSAVELAALLGAGEEPFLLDVRQPEELAAGAIPGVVNVPLGELAHRLRDLPVGRPVVVVCASGNRSSQATAFLTRSGYQALNLTGGMAAWGRVHS